MVMTTGGSLHRKRGDPVLFYAPNFSSLNAGKNGCAAACADPTGGNRLIGCRLGGHASCTAKPMALSTRPHSPLAVCRASGPCPLATSSNDAVQTFSVRTRSLTPCLNLGPARVTSRLATIIAMEGQGGVVDGDRVGRHRHDTNTRLRIRSPGSGQDSLGHPAGDKM